MNEMAVAWQRRVKLKSDGPDSWSSWSECDEGRAKFAQDNGHPEHYPTVDAEVRPLYLSSKSVAEAQEKLIEEMRDMLERARNCVLNEGYYAFSDEIQSVISKSSSNTPDRNDE